MKRILILGLLVCLVMSLSCKKNGGDPPTFWESIDGVYIRDSTGTVIDSLGTPNVLTEDSVFKFNIYSNPCSDTLKFDVLTNPNEEFVSYSSKIYTAEFKNLPATLPPSIGEGNIPVENAHINGAFAVKESGITGVAGGTSIASYWIVSDLPRGFYKLEIKVENGKTYWENIWIYRP